MSSHLVAGKVYRDIEKIFRLIALYRGNAEQLQHHVKIVESNIRKHFSKISDEFIRLDLFINGVYSDEKEVFKADRPESTVAYALFCEGVQALFINRLVPAEEILSWCLLVRDFLDKRDHDSSDLASVLWKKNFPHFRVYFYSLLLEADEKKEGGFQEKSKKAQVDLDNETKGFVHWHKRDKDWELPSADLILKSKIETDDLDTSKVAKLKESLSDASLSDRAQRIMAFESDEIESLSQEFSSYDVNQVDFNLLVLSFSLLLNDQSKLSEKVHAKIAHNLKVALSSIIQRFHGGLLVFFISQMSLMEKKKGLEREIIQLRKTLSESFVKKENIELLAKALADENRRKVAMQLIIYLDRASQAKLADFIFEGDRNLVIQVLRTWISRDVDFDQALAQWGEDRIILLLPFLDSLDWQGKAKFYARCLQFKSSKLIGMILPKVGALNLKIVEALVIYDRLNDEQKKVWAESILASGDSARSSAPFVKALIASGRWAKSSDVVMDLWAQVASRVLRPEAETIFSKFLTEKRFFFFPKYPQHRRSILKALGGNNRG